MVRNLVANALRHGAPEEPVRVSLRGDESQVAVEVANRGTADLAIVRTLFEPLARGATEPDRDSQSGLGLGLYIVREIARAHGGEVQVSSRDDEAFFTVLLPRTRAAEIKSAGAALSASA